MFQDGVVVSCSRGWRFADFRLLKMRTLHCLEMSRTKYHVTEFHIPGNWYLTSCSSFCDACYVVCSSYLWNQIFYIFNVGIACCRKMVVSLLIWQRLFTVGMQLPGRLTGLRKRRKIFHLQIDLWHLIWVWSFGPQRSTSCSSALHPSNSQNSTLQLWTAISRYVSHLTQSSYQM